MLVIFVMRTIWRLMCARQCVCVYYREIALDIGCKVFILADS